MEPNILIAPMALVNFENYIFDHSIGTFLHGLMHVTLIELKLPTIYKNFSSNHDFVSKKKFLQVFDKWNGAAAGSGAAIRNFGSGFRRPFNFGSLALGSGSGSGSTTLESTRKSPPAPLPRWGDNRSHVLGCGRAGNFHSRRSSFGELMFNFSRFKVSIASFSRQHVKLFLL
jgi:hypothetical protein